MQLDALEPELVERPVGDQPERASRDPAAARLRGDDVADLTLPRVQIEVDHAAEAQKRRLGREDREPGPGAVLASPRRSGRSTSRRSRAAGTREPACCGPRPGPRAAAGSPGRSDRRAARAGSRRLRAAAYGGLRPRGTSCTSCRSRTSTVRSGRASRARRPSAAAGRDSVLTLPASPPRAPAITAAPASDSCSYESPPFPTAECLLHGPQLLGVLGLRAARGTGA